jgi:hypothetical protein
MHSEGTLNLHHKAVGLPVLAQGYGNRVKQRTGRHVVAGEIEHVHHALLQRWLLLDGRVPDSPDVRCRRTR